jgi:hypothetical protein
MNGALASRARRRAISVLPTPVGPIIRMFFGVISWRKGSATCAPPPAVAQRDRHRLLGLALADDVLVEFVNDFLRSHTICLPVRLTVVRMLSKAPALRKSIRVTAEQSMSTGSVAAA